MAHDLIIYSGIMLVYSIVILWITSLSMIRDKCIKDYLGFFILGMVLVFQSSLIAFHVFLNMIWFFFEAVVFFTLIWIFFTLKGLSK